ncbi:Chemoreceptor glutamine deamidase CheD [Rhodocyclaceae bacterium]|nr:Chemoreceptor glutamine deamidase CheD [Rhodocyclaceae bacterium]
MTPTREIYLEPGDFHFGAAPLRLCTILGSCVAVTLWHPRLHVGGMCHIQMATPSPTGSGGPLDGRYAEDAFVLFDQAVARNGAPFKEYVVKLFGGGNMFPDSGASSIDVGPRNIAAARRLLAARGLPIKGEHVGGAGHRKLVFDLASGEVRLAFSNLAAEKEAAIV